MSDPVFDITLLNTASRPLILTRIGIEITLVSHSSTLSIRPHASKIEVARSYTLNVPDILTLCGPFGDEPATLQEVVVLDLSDPIYMPAEAPFRYGLVLRDYCRHMPQEVYLHLWAQTDAGIARSALLHMSLFR